MKNTLIALAVAVAACGLAAAQPPQGGMEAPKMEQAKPGKMDKMDKKEMKKIKLNKWKGTVKAVDAAAGKITVTDKKGMTMTMPVTAETKIMKNGKPIAFADLKAGEKVRIMYEGDMKMPMVRKIKVETPGKKEGMEKMEREEKQGMMHEKPMMPEKPAGGMKK
jgi:hypothetical protein